MATSSAAASYTTSRGTTRESLLAPADPSTGTAAKSEFAILSQQLAAILPHDGNAMTPDMREEVEQSQAIIADPVRVAMFREADCAQLRARRRELRQQLGGWLQGGSCHPSDIVVDRLATLALDCSVSLSLLAELVEEVGHDTGGRQGAMEPAR